MPETSVDKNCNFASRITNVGMSRNLPLKAVSAFTCFTQSPPENQLRFGILASIRTHCF